MHSDDIILELEHEYSIHDGINTNDEAIDTNDKQEVSQ
jgi:hypothetical protein